MKEKCIKISEIRFICYSSNVCIFPFLRTKFFRSVFQDTSRTVFDHDFGTYSLFTLFQLHKHCPGLKKTKNIFVSVTPKKTSPVLSTFQFQGYYKLAFTFIHVHHCQPYTHIHIIRRITFISTFPSNSACLLFSAVKSKDNTH